MHRFSAAYALFVLVSSAPPALAGEAEVLLLNAPSEGVRLAYGIRPAESGLQIQLRNQGTTPLHFRLHLAGQGGKDMRVHLAVGGRATLWLPSQPTRVGVTEVRITEGDEGPWWQE